MLCGKAFWWGVKNFLPCLCGSAVATETPVPYLFRGTSSVHALKQVLPPPDAPSCWSMTSFKIALAEWVHLRWQGRFADIAHSPKFREVLMWTERGTNCIRSLAEAGNFSIFFFNSYFTYSFGIFLVVVYLGAGYMGLDKALKAYPVPFKSLSTVCW